MLKKVVSILNFTMPLLESYPTYVKILVGLWVLLTIVLLLSLWFFRPHQKDSSKSAAPPEKTPLYAKTEQRINDFYIDIDRNKLTPWSFFSTGKMPEVKYYDGKPINSKGAVEFMGSPRVVFWGNFIEPFLEHGIIDILEQVKDAAVESKLNPELCVNEAVDLLDSVITKVYHRMAKIDQNLRGKGYPKNVDRKDVSKEIEKMVGYLMQQQKAIIEIIYAQKEKWYQTSTFKYVVIPLLAIVITLAGILVPVLQSKTSYPSLIDDTNIFADVSKDGTVLRSNNFPWEIRKSNDSDGNILYTIVDRRGDSTAVSVVPDNPKYTVYQSYDGMMIKFVCSEEEILNFTINLKY